MRIGARRREGLPDYDTFADAAYNFCTVRSLDAWDLSMLKVLNVWKSKIYA